MISAAVGEESRVKRREFITIDIRLPCQLDFGLGWVCELVVQLARPTEMDRRRPRVVIRFDPTAFGLISSLPLGDLSCTRGLFSLAPTGQRQVWLKA